MDNETNVVHEFPSDAMSVEEATAIENQENMITTEETSETAGVVEESSVAAETTEVAEETTEGEQENTEGEQAVAETGVGMPEETAEESAEAAADVAAEIPAEAENTQETPKEPISKMKAHSIGYAAGVGVLLILVFIRLIVMDNHVNKLETELQEAVEAKKTAEMDLEREKTTLEEKIALLSDKVAVQIVADEEAEAKKVPSGLPVTGRVSIVAEPVFVDEDGDGEPDGDLTAFIDNGDHTWSKPIESDDGEEIIITQENITALPVVFGASAGSKVVASGAGKVLTIESDETYGNAVVIDHENGYMTIYTYMEEPKVNVGDEILKGQLIFDITGDNAEVEFQVFLNDEPIDPMDIIMISG